MHLHIAADDAHTEELVALVRHFRPEYRVIEFDAWDCLPYDRVSPKLDVMGARVAALVQLLNGSTKPTLIITTVAATAQRVMPKSALQGHSLVLSAGTRKPVKEIQNYLEGNAYTRASTVREAGEYAIRGGIVDLFPADAETPVRIDFFGDEIEKLQNFDPVTQLSIGAIDAVNLIPAREVILTKENISNFRTGYREHFGAAALKDPIYETITDSRPFPGMEHYLPLFYEQSATFFDYLPPDTQITLDHQWRQAANERAKHIQDHYQARMEFLGKSGAIYRPLPAHELYLNEKEFSAAIEKFTAAETDPFNNELIRPLPSFAEARTQRGGAVFHAAAEFIRANPDKEILLTGYSEGSLERLQHLFSEHEPGLKIPSAILPIEKGFTTAKIVIITEEDILGDRLVRTPKRKSNQKFMQELAAMQPGDLVVHAEHGVGKFISLETITVAGAAHDCMLLEYSGGDKLYVPVENLDVLTRFGQGDAQLDKLGSAHFQSRKAAVKKRLKDMADELIKIAAARAMNTAKALEPNAGFAEFCARFPYAETDDQLKAIEDVIADLGSGRASDRLICGDVGFGKTEVALRAAFVAAMAGMQVAICAPTTLLARQHYLSFSQRFSGMPIRIAQLSRLVPA
ncbi:MAG TPA: CarD family transcriptional regulator, partial [Alphaproteobacteria bacterium]|nr:CarD family transcriptional regulator [Alphaproteobacteria bacterium]